MPTALFIFAFTSAYRHVRWMGPVVSGIVFGFPLHLSQLIHRRLLLKLRRNGHGGQDPHALRDRRHGPTIREPHVPQHGLPERRAIVRVSCGSDCAYSVSVL